MSNVLELKPRVPAMAESAIEQVRVIEQYLATLPQAPIRTHHVLHGGTYTRTIMIPAGVMLAGALIDVATTLVVCGECQVLLGEDHVARLSGYNVLPASAHRKQAFMAITDTYLTMMFATNAQTIAQAEDHFTREAHLLMSRQPGHENITIITGE